MPIYDIPITVNVAPVQTYRKTIKVEAETPAQAARLVQAYERPGNSILQDAINSPGWKPVGGRLEPIPPHLTAYDTYLDTPDLDAWVAAQQKEA